MMTKAVCPDCRSVCELRADGSFALHRDRGGRRCPRSGKQIPEWLNLLAEGYSTGQVADLWTARQAAEHLGVTDAYVRRILQPADRVPGPGGVHYLYDPFDVHELRQYRERLQPLPRAGAAVPIEQPQTTAERAAAVRRHRRYLLAKRELIDGRLVATNVETHGSLHAYKYYGCRCEPCSAANAEAKRRRWRMRRMANR
jgi:hypothetical protein